MVLPYTSLFLWLRNSIFHIFSPSLCPAKRKFLAGRPRKRQSRASASKVSMPGAVCRHGGRCQTGHFLQGTFLVEAKVQVPLLGRRSWTTSWDVEYHPSPGGKGKIALPVMIVWIHLNTTNRKQDAICKSSKHLSAGPRCNSWPSKSISWTSRAYRSKRYFFSMKKTSDPSAPENRRGTSSVLPWSLRSRLETPGFLRTGWKVGMTCYVFLFAWVISCPVSSLEHEKIDKSLSWSMYKHHPTDMCCRQRAHLHLWRPVRTAANSPVSRHVPSCAKGAKGTRRNAPHGSWHVMMRHEEAIPKKASQMRQW